MELAHGVEEKTRRKKKKGKKKKQRLEFAMRLTKTTRLNAKPFV